MVRECRRRYGRRKMCRKTCLFPILITSKNATNNHNLCSIVDKYMLVDSKCRRTSYHHILYNIYNMVRECRSDMAEFESNKEDIHDLKKWSRNVMKRKSNPIRKQTINRSGCYNTYN